LARSTKAFCEAVWATAAPAATPRAATAAMATKSLRFVMSKPPFVSEQVGVFAEQVLQFLIQLDADIGVQLGVDLQRLAKLDVHRRRACGQADGAKAKHGDDLTLADHGADLRRRRWKSPPSNAAASERVLNKAKPPIKAAHPSSARALRRAEHIPADPRRSGWRSTSCRASGRWAYRTADSASCS